MPRDLSRLLRPASIAVAGGLWAGNVIKQLQKAGYSGDIWPLHPAREEILGLPCFAAVEDLPRPPDAVFIGVNRELTIDMVARLSALGAGGAVCFASGFAESEAELAGGARLQEQLLQAAGDMPVLGPNCYGVLNYIDNVPLWPDEHGGVAVDSGVGIITQSSNIAINLSMQDRGLPLAYLVTAGNQAQTDAANIAESLLRNPQVSAVGFYLEGFASIRSFERVAELARATGKPLVALKAGRSAAARHATLSHSASLNGSDAAGSALLARLGIVEVHSLDVFLETLKLLHFCGPLASHGITSTSCSGGEAALMADACEDLALHFCEFSEGQRQALRDCLGERVNLANPLDYHTYIWGDVSAMSACFRAVCAAGAALNLFVVDIPRQDRCDPAAWDCAVQALKQVRTETSAPIAVIASLAENMSEPLAQRFIQNGCVPLNGMRSGLLAVEAAARAGDYQRRPVPPQPLLLVPVDRAEHSGTLLAEHEAKAMLAQHGVAVPAGRSYSDMGQLTGTAAAAPYPCALKTLGLAHKSEAGAVVLGIPDAETLLEHARRMEEEPGAAGRGFLVEEMIAGVVAELLVGITRDATGLFVLTLGFGGTQTELLGDSVCLLLPAAREDILEALKTLRLYPLLEGYRGGPVVELDAVLDTVESLCSFARVHAGRLLELEVNPLMVQAGRAVAADALLRLST